MKLLESVGYHRQKQLPFVAQRDRPVESPEQFKLEKLLQQTNLLADSPGSDIQFDRRGSKAEVSASALEGLQSFKGW